MATLNGLPWMRFWPGGTSPSVTSLTLNQSTDAVEIILQMPEDMSLSRAGIRQGTVTGTAPSYKVSFQGVDASGNPDGTIKGGGSPASTVFTPTAGGNNTFQWKTLDNAYAAARGEMLAMVIQHDSGTIDAGNCCSFGIAADVGPLPGIPYAIQNENGTRSRLVASPLFGYGPSGTAYGLPVNATINSSFSSASTPDEKALLFNLPSTLVSSYRVIGGVFTGFWLAGSTFDIALYDADGSTVLAQTAFDTDHDRNTTIPRSRPLFFDDPPTVLAAGSSYRLSLIPGAANLTLVGVAVAADADMDAYPYGGAIAKSSTRTDGGAWADDPKTRFGIDLILSDITLPAAGSSYPRGRVVNGGGV